MMYEVTVWRTQCETWIVDAEDLDDAEAYFDEGQLVGDATTDLTPEARVLLDKLATP